MMQELGESVEGYKIRDMIKEVDLNKDGTVSLKEFEEVSQVREMVLGSTS